MPLLVDQTLFFLWSFGVDLSLVESDLHRRLISRFLELYFTNKGSLPLYASSLWTLLVPSHLAFRFYRLACWWALSLGFCDSSNKSSTLEHKRTASLYRIALPLSLVSHWLTPTVFVSVSRSDRLACASCLWFDTLIVQWQDQCLLLASLSLEQ